MILQTPIKPKSYGPDAGIIYLTQLFGGKNLDYTKLGLAGHNGLDFRTLHIQDGQAAVFATHNGEIVSDKNIQSDTAGRFVKILSEETEINGRSCRILSVYFHLHSCIQEKGTLVKAGMKIGIAGNTGSFTNGPHLHFGIYPLWRDLSWLPEENEYGGAIDPTPFLLDNNVYQYGTGFFGRKFFRNGQRISRKEVGKLV